MVDGMHWTGFAGAGAGAEGACAAVRGRCNPRDRHAELLILCARIGFNP